jgi:hypothetical protein
MMTPLLLVAALAAADIAMGVPSAAVEFGVPVCAQQQQQTVCSPPQPALDRGCRQPLTLPASVLHTRCFAAAATPRWVAVRTIRRAEPAANGMEQVRHTLPTTAAQRRVDRF